MYGKIVKVEDKALTIKTKVKEGEGKEITIAVDDKTVIALDKKEAKLADLKADMMCRITPDTASDKVAAETISAFTPKAQVTDKQRSASAPPSPLAALPAMTQAVAQRRGG